MATGRTNAVGTAMNFTVVGGTSSPSSPKENTIWVKTSTVGTVSFGPAATPSYSAATNAVYIGYAATSGSTSSGSRLSFIKGKANIAGVPGELLSCYQYQSYTWKRVYAYIYKSGSWVQFSSDFSASISVSYPSGATLTCSDGYTTLTATTTSGSYTFDVPNSGTWTVRATSGSNSDSETVSISYSGQSTSVTLSFFDGYLFNYGSVNENVTGGWTAKNVPHVSGYSGYPNATAQIGGSLVIAMGDTDKSGMYVTQNKIDLTKYSTITFYGYTWDYNGYGRAALQVMSSIGTLSSDNVVASFFENNKSVASHTIDIASLSGSYYIGFRIIFDGEAKMCSLKLT